MNTDKSNREQIIIDYINENESISDIEVCALLSLKDSSVKKIFSLMAKNGLIEPVGERKSRRYILPAK